MKTIRIPLAIGLIVVPVLLRTIWFYQGIYWRPEPVPTPDYASYRIPTPALSTPLPEPKLAPGEGQIILLDEAHSNSFSLADVEGLSKQLVERGARIEPVPPVSFMGESSLAWKLKYASAYITIAPMQAYTPEETLQLKNFVDHGGRLLVITDPTRTYISSDPYGYSTFLIPDFEVANMLLAPYDLAFTGDYLYNMTENEGNFQNVYFDSFGKNTLTQDLSKVVLYVTHSMTTKTGTPLLISSAKTQSTRLGSGSALVSAAVDASGSVLAIGDLTFMTPPYNQVADNPVFLNHIADFLLTAPRIHDLSDFPFVFTKPVTIVSAEDVGLGTELFPQLHALQSALVGAGRITMLATKAEDGKDLVLLETYSSKDIEALLAPFQITLPGMGGSASSKMQIPGIGGIATSGTGLILFHRDSARSTVILVAEDATALSDLLDILGTEGFRNCLLQGDIGVCPTASGGSNASWSDLFGNGFSYPTETPRPVRPTSTPAG
jgi:hypothetical protein